MRALFNSLGAMIASRRRLFAAACIGMAAGFILPASLASQTRAIIGWDVLVTVYLILIGWLFSTQKTDRMAANAAAQMEGEWTIFWIILAAVAASFAAILFEFSLSKDMPAGVRSFHIALVCFTLLASWLMTHTVFAMRYAHEYYEISPGNTEIDRGLEFPSDALPDYWDFFYFALVLGMTFQVSDVQITSRALRRLATAHGLLGFLFNTVIIALTVNIGASLL
jgi:uncharacterized membrane protein